MAKQYKEVDLVKCYIQACIDCGFIPSKQKVKAVEKIVNKDKFLNISEIDCYGYEERMRAPKRKEELKDILDDFADYLGGKK